MKKGDLVTTIVDEVGIVIRRDVRYVEIWWSYGDKSWETIDDLEKVNESR